MIMSFCGASDPKSQYEWRQILSTAGANDNVRYDDGRFVLGRRIARGNSRWLSLRASRRSNPCGPEHSWAGHQRAAFPDFDVCRIFAAREIGTAKFEPEKPDRIAKFTPITFPLPLNTGPPDPPEVVWAS